MGYVSFRECKSPGVFCLFWFFFGLKSGCFFLPPEKFPPGKYHILPNGKAGKSNIIDSKVPVIVFEICDRS